ncbi:MAG: hypothetical protein IJ681_04795 [Bacteroidales bacterium]|nr:hypothetical protein [Bacteroidales bacterium]
MKLSKVILTLITVLLILGVISLVFPKDGVTIGDVKLKFPTIEDIFFDSAPQYADIEQIIEEESEEPKQEKKVQRVKVKDGIVVNIELPEDKPYYLDNLFESLNNIEKKGDNVRIIHYGDSQIEGDRITSYLRKRLQSTFGGSGQGEIPLYSHSNIKNAIISYSDNCKFFSIIDTAKTSFRNFGLMQNAVVTNSDTARIDIKFIRPVAQNMTLYCRANSENTVINVFSGTDLLKSYTFEKTHTLVGFSITHSAQVKSLRIETVGETELYSLDLSEKNGIYVDNVPLRGSAGWGFTRNNSEFLAYMSEKLNVKLLILQFGVNAVPQDEEFVMDNYRFYETQLIRQVQFLQKTNPDAAIIIVGISDRSRKKGDGYETNPNIPKILAAQRQAAEKCGVAFWNLFDAMGGENSMPSWVLRERPLANSDFIHFNAKGAEYVGEMFYKALENAYFDYQSR